MFALEKCLCTACSSTLNVKALLAIFFEDDIFLSIGSNRPVDTSEVWSPTKQVWRWIYEWMNCLWHMHRMKVWVGRWLSSVWCVHLQQTKLTKADGSWLSAWCVLAFRHWKMLHKWRKGMGLGYCQNSTLWNCTEQIKQHLEGRGTVSVGQVLGSHKGRQSLIIKILLICCLSFSGIL